MEHKMKYIAPAILEELKIEMEGGILYASQPVVNDDFQDVDTMGQEVVEDDANLTFDHFWDN